MKSAFLIFICSLSISIFAQHQIGHYQVTFQDPERANRNIQTEIYYPATTAGESTPAAAGQFPVIVFGHGFVMAWSAYENLWQEFVPRGYIMVFPRTEGSIISTDHQQFGWDLEYLVSQIQTEGLNASSPINGVVANNTALMGHSMGGGASFLAADSLCGNGNTQLKTLIGLAPAESSTNGVSSINSSLSVTVPALILSGSQDGVTPPIDHHIPMYNNLASDCKTFVNITGGAHCYFANSNAACDFGEGTSSSGIAITRLEQHDITFGFVNNWLDYTLKSNCLSFQHFQDSVNTSSRVVTTQSCASNPIAVISDNSGTLTSNISGSGYQWFLDGNRINGATNNSYNATINGTDTLELSFASGCPTLSNSINISSGSVSVFENGTFNIKFFPNPTEGIVTLSQIADVSLYNLSGALIKNYLLVTQIDISFLPKGVYLMKHKETFQKIVKI